MARSGSRRTLLATVATALSAGCLGAMSARLQPRLLHTVALTTEATPSSNLAADVEVVDRRITTASTARLRITYTNASTDSVTVGTAPWESHVSVGEVRDPDNPALLLVKPDNSLERRAPDCWHPAGEVGFSLVAAGTELAPEETLTLDYDVWGHDGEDAADPCIQAFDYRFEFPEGLRFTLAVE